MLLLQGVDVYRSQFTLRVLAAYCGSLVMPSTSSCTTFNIVSIVPMLGTVNSTLRSCIPIRPTDKRRRRYVHPRLNRTRNQADQPTWGWLMQSTQQRAAGNCPARRSRFQFFGDVTPPPLRGRNDSYSISTAAIKSRIAHLNSQRVGSEFVCRELIGEFRITN